MSYLKYTGRGRQIYFDIWVKRHVPANYDCFFSMRKPKLKPSGVSVLYYKTARELLSIRLYQNAILKLMFFGKIIGKLLENS